MGFHYQDGYLYSEKLRVKDIQEQIDYSPFTLYSKSEITQTPRKGMGW